MNEPLDVATWIRQLEEERDRLSLVIEEARRRSGIAASDTGSATLVTGRQLEGNGMTGQIRPDEFFRMSIRESIMRLLAIMKRPQSPKAIVEGLRAGGVLSEAKHFYANTFTELKRMEARGLVANTSNGWGLTEWYPSKAKPFEPLKAKKRAKRKTLAATVSKSLSKTKRARSTGKGDRAPLGIGYRQFVKQGRLAGKSLKEIGAEWQVLKDSEA